jgi:hypothetical protein
MTPETKFLHQNTKDMTMPANLDHHKVITCPCPLWSSPPCHLASPYSAAHARQGPWPRRSRQSPSPDVITLARRARAHTGMALDAPVPACSPTTPSTSHSLFFTHLLLLTSASYRTTALDRSSAVANATITVLRHGYHST